MTPNFAKQLERGRQGERVLDQFFGTAFDVAAVGIDDQLAGIDRTFRRRVDGKRTKVEYKTDFRAHLTGNAFIETTCGLDGRIVAGWSMASHADVLAYYVPGLAIAYIIQFDRLRLHLGRWRKRCKTAAVLVDGWHANGLLVPLTELERIAYRVLAVQP